jgi:hypothetical protein
VCHLTLGLDATSHSVWECQSRAKYLSKEKLTQRVKGNVTHRAHVWHGTLSLGTLGCLSAPGDTRVDNKHLSTANVHYFVSAHNVKRRGALIDRGANGGIAGNDTRVIHKHLRKVDVTGPSGTQRQYCFLYLFRSKNLTNLGP